MAAPGVSFLLTAYEQEAFVGPAVRAALAQDWTPLEIILSDDGSRDGTFAVMEGEVASYAGPHVVRLNRNAENLGSSEHLRKLMTMAQGEFIVIGHGDDISLPHRVRRLVEVQRAQRKTLLCSNAVMIESDGEPLGFYSGENRSREITFEELVEHGWRRTMLGAGLAWDRELFERFPPIDRRALPTGIDVVLPFRAALLKGVYFIAEPLLRYRRHGGSLTHLQVDRSGGALERDETNAAVLAGIALYLLRDLAALRRRGPDSDRLAAAEHKLQQKFLAAVYRWNRLRNELWLRGMRPRWVDKSVLRDLPVREELRVGPEAPFTAAGRKKWRLDNGG